MTSRSSTERAAPLSTALLNSKSSVEAMFTTAGFFGASGAGFAAAGAGVAAGAGAGVGAGAGAGAGASWVAQPINSERAAAIDAAASVTVLIFPSLFLLRVRARFKHKTRRFCEGKPALA